MKRIFLFLAACLLLAACGKDDDSVEDSGARVYEAGTRVTIKVGVDERAAKVAGSSSDAIINFKWETGDKIKVIASSPLGIVYPVEFTLKSGAGTSSATFEGIMPEMPEFEGWEDEIEYRVVYPYEDDRLYPNAEDLANQTYVEGGFASGLMSFMSEGLSSLDDPIKLSCNYAVVRLNLYGVGRSVSKIVLSNKNGGSSYTLTCPKAVTVGKDKDHATPFYIVINEDNNFGLKVDVTMNEVAASESDLPDYGTYGKGYAISSPTIMQSSERRISGGQYVNMPAVSLTTIWAPVNCGYDPVNFKYGKFYQWGRKDGCGYVDYYNSTHGLTDLELDDAGGLVQFCPNPGYVTSPIAEGDEDATVYYNTTYIVYNGVDSVSYNTDWLSTRNNYRWDGTGGSEYVHIPTKTKYDPCPEGWRLPTRAEMTALLGGISSTGFSTGTHGVTAGLNGKWFNGSSESNPTTGVFLPVVGYRNSLSTAACAYRRDVSATYWTSSVSGDRACSMGYGNSTKPSVSTNSNRAGGYAVRCVHE